MVVLLTSIYVLLMIFTCRDVNMSSRTKLWIMIAWSVLFILAIMVATHGRP